jgi:iron complex outermembrane receptor protein
LKILTGLAAVTACICANLVAVHPANAQAQSTSGPAAAPPAADTDASVGLEEVTVTAQRRTDTVQKTAMAIQAMDASALQTMGNIDDARDLAVAVPSIHVASLGIYSNLYVHGVGGGISNAYGSPAVSYSMDGVFIDQAAGPSSALYDIDRIELVQGPQGTLYGRNATAGALNVIPSKPVFKDEGFASLEYGNYNAVETAGTLNIPFSSTVATRFAFKTSRHDGYLSNGTNDEDSQAGRAQILWQASDNLSLLGYLDYFHEGGEGMQSVPLYPGRDLSSFGTGAIAPGLPAGQLYLNPKNPWQAISSDLLYPTLIPAPYPTAIPLAGRDAGIDHNQYIYHLQADWDLGFATATVLPAIVRTNDDDIFYQAGFRAHETDDITQSSVEARLASNASTEWGKKLRWVTGVFWFHTSGQSLGQFFQEGVSDISLLLPEMKDDSKAVFGQLTYSVTDRLRVTGGIRYTNESKSESGQTIVGNLFLLPPPTPATCSAPFTYYPAVYDGTPNPARCGAPNQGDLHFTSTDYKGAVEFDLTNRSLLYANYSTGFKAGGFNPGSPPNTYAPEKLRDYDLGTKSRFLDNRLQINTSAFYWLYDNQQAQAFGPINPGGYAYIVYPSKSHIYGASIDLKALLTRQDKFGFEVDYQRGIYDYYQTASIPALGIVGVNGADAVRPYTPTFSEHLDYTHTFELANDASLDFNLNTLFVDSEYVYTTPYVPLGYQPAYHKSNASLAYHSHDDVWTIEAYVNNIENKFTVNSLQPSSTTGNYFAYVDPPRTYGVRVSRTF